MFSKTIAVVDINQYLNRLADVHPNQTGQLDIIETALDLKGAKGDVLVAMHPGCYWSGEDVFGPCTVPGYVTQTRIEEPIPTEQSMYSGFIQEGTSYRAAGHTESVFLRTTEADLIHCLKKLLLHVDPSDAHSGEGLEGNNKRYLALSKNEYQPGVTLLKADDPERIQTLLACTDTLVKEAFVRLVPGFMDQTVESIRLPFKMGRLTESMGTYIETDVLHNDHIQYPKSECALKDPRVTAKLREFKAWVSSHFEQDLTAALAV